MFHFQKPTASILIPFAFIYLSPSKILITISHTDIIKTTITG